jgi:protein-S-isoprenylcysteine O-methyltransferase Ste14
MPQTPGNAGVIAPPPLMLLAALALGFALDRAAPLGGLDAIATSVRWIVGGALIAIAIVVNLWGFFGFQRSGAPVNPYRSVTKLVTHGVFAHVRNPMYLGMILLTLGLAVALAGEWLAICGLLLWIAIHFGVVRREERYLEAIFGDEYRAYKSRVPPYGWRF